MAQGWANVALGRYLMRRPPEEIVAAWERAVTLGPMEDDVTRLMLNVVLGSWDEAPPPMREWLNRLRVQAEQRDEIERWAQYYKVALPTPAQ